VQPDNAAEPTTSNNINRKLIVLIILIAIYLLEIWQKDLVAPTLLQHVRLQFLVYQKPFRMKLKGLQL